MIEILYFDGCPNHDSLEARIRGGQCGTLAHRPDANFDQYVRTDDEPATAVPPWPDAGT
jgi:hypothetical protein